MAITDTIVFGAYQAILGTTYARGYQEAYNMGATYEQYVLARQAWIAGMSSSEVSSGITVVNAHLSAENTYTSAVVTNIVKPVLSAVTSFFSNVYSTPARDFFNCLTPARNITWRNSFKEAWYQANAQELVQQIGFATWDGSGVIVYPAFSPITNAQNQIGVAVTSGNNITVTNFLAPVSNFALPGDIIVGSVNTALPAPASISLGTTLVGYANTNVLVLSGPIGLATNLFAFRPLKGTEYLEFRFGPAMMTGLAATTVVADIGLTVTLIGGVSTTVTIGTANTTGRVNIGVYNSATYKARGVTGITVTTGSWASLGTQQSLELWVRSTN